MEGDALWVWSRSQPVQRGFVLPPGGGFTELPSRMGPLATRRCVVGSEALAGATFCVGEQEPRGLRSFGTSAFDPELPPRGR